MVVLPKFKQRVASVPEDDAGPDLPGSDALENSSDYGTAVNLISDSTLKFREAEIADYAMLSRIDFSNPLFQSMSDPQFNDFSKIRFWAHRVISEVDDDAPPNLRAVKLLAEYLESAGGEIDFGKLDALSRRSRRAPRSVRWTPLSTARPRAACSGSLALSSAT